MKGRRSLVEKERKGRIERKTDDKGEIGSREVGMNEVKSGQIRLKGRGREGGRERESRMRMYRTERKKEREGRSKEDRERERK